MLFVDFCWLVSFLVERSEVGTPPYMFFFWCCCTSYFLGIGFSSWCSTEYLEHTDLYNQAMIIF